MELEEATIEPMNIGGAYYDDIEFSIKKKKVYYKNQYYNKNTLMLIIHLFFLVILFSFSSPHFLIHFFNEFTGQFVVIKILFNRFYAIATH